MADNLANDDSVSVTQTSDELARVYQSQTSKTPTTTSNQVTRSPKRPKNPLADFASYNYQLSLYAITPDAYNEFVTNGRKSIDSLYDDSGKGIYLILQSGGINNDDIPRAPGFVYDYYIDNLKIQTAVSPKAAGTSSAVTDITFNIIEPYGFSFISNLKIATTSIQAYSASKNLDNPDNPSKQFFILGIRFFGYDAAGQLLSGSKGMFERYFDISINEIHFKIDGKNTVYNIHAVGTSMQTTMGIKRGMINKGAELTGKTVEDLLIGNDPAAGLFGLCTKLNKDENDNKQTKSKNTYSIKFIGEDANLIKSAVIKSQADLDKSKFKMASVKSVSGVNLQLAEKAVVDVNSRNIVFKNDTPILQAIQQIISQSSYISDALEEVYTTDKQSNPKSDAPNEIVPDTKRHLRWFNVTPQVKNPRWNKNMSDYVFDITYVIQSYKTPVILNTIGNKTDRYYGPVKRYDYWYTGKNTEVIRYEQSLNNTYFNVTLTDDDTPQGTGGQANVSKVSGKYSPVIKLGKMNVGMQAQNQYITQLIDPGSFSSATIEIMGDPDLLIQPATEDSEGEEYDPFYFSNGSVNPNAGQIFIEIDFKEARDYDTGTGTLTINDKIVLWEYPPKIIEEYKIQGISYNVIEITNYFRRGKFTQELACVINAFDDTDIGSSTPDNGRPSNGTGKPGETQMADSAARSNAGAVGSAATPSGSTTSSTGMKKVPETSKLSPETQSLLNRYPKPPVQSPDDDQSPPIPWGF